jgi:hypothetical protein
VLVAARRLLGVARQTDSLMHATQSRLDQQVDQRRRDAATRQLRSAQDAVQRSRQGWHSFNLALTDSSLTQAARLARRADSVLSAKPRR